MEELLEDVKVSLRVVDDAFNSEIEMLIAAAVADMTRVGIDRDYINECKPLVKHAICCYAKAHFGYDNPEAAFFNDSYRQIVTDLLNSRVNIAAMEMESDD